MRKNSTLVNPFKCFVFFAVDYVILLPTELKFDIKLQSKPFFFSKKHIFAFLTKHRGLKDNFSEKPLSFCQLNCTFICKKKKINVISASSEIMSLKSDQLEILFSVYAY